MNLPSSIRILHAGDIPRILSIAHTVGWTQTAPDLERMLRYAPDGCFGLELPPEGEWQGGLVSTAMAFSHGLELGWIAMVLTDPAFRGQGLASRLMEHAIQHLRERGTHWIKLDASDLGRPIYERMGFAAENLMERRLRIASPLPLLPSALRIEESDAMPMALDYHGFGADRGRLLRMLAGIEGARTAVLAGGGGYAILRPNSRGSQLGPMVCENAAAAETLLRWAIEQSDGRTVQWDLIRENESARALADAYGFETHRLLHRMALAGVDAPPPFAGLADLVYAIAGFDFG
ncbi:MAG: GNAT family N-acetyltransferase [Bryobacterales bacterium]|nr:GNAT family N-acetyltransferase [Bryobacterales bacterium]